MTRVCLLTGAGGELGDAFCRLLAADYSIVAVHHGAPPLVTTQSARLFDPLAPRRTVPESQAPVFAVRADLDRPSEVDRVVELSLARFGPVDLLVNAAADVRTSTLTTEPHLDAWQDQLLMNVVVPVHLAAALAVACWRSTEPENAERRRNVVNVTSTAGLAGPPGRGRGFYGASKAALNVLTRQMAEEYAPMGIRVNAVAPTYFPQVVPTRRVVRAVRALDEGAMSGKVLVMDGARMRWT